MSSCELGHARTDLADHHHRTALDWRSRSAVFALALALALGRFVPNEIRVGCHNNDLTLSSNAARDRAPKELDHLECGEVES